jgi:hypothetical protein
MAVLLSAPYQQFFDDDGDPLTLGEVYFYEAGTDTPKDTYTDYTGTIPAANPVELDAAGRATIWVEGDYKITVKDADGVTIRTVDHVEVVDQGGDMTKAVYDPANISQQLVGTTAVQTLTNKTLTNPVINTLSSWTTFTPGVSVNTGAITNYTATGRYRRIGQNLEVQFAITFSGTPSNFGNLFVGYPSGITADVTLLPVTPSAGYRLGAGYAYDASVGSPANYPLYIGYHTTSIVQVFAVNSAATYLVTNVLSQAIPITYTTSDVIEGSFTIPAVFP